MCKCIMSPSTPNQPPAPPMGARGGLGALTPPKSPPSRPISGGWHVPIEGLHVHHRWCGCPPAALTTPPHQSVLRRPPRLHQAHRCRGRVCCCRAARVPGRQSAPPRAAQATPGSALRPPRPKRAGCGTWRTSWPAPIGARSSGRPCDGGGEGRGAVKRQCVGIGKGYSLPAAAMAQADELRLIPGAASTGGLGEGMAADPRPVGRPAKG